MNTFPQPPGTIELAAIRGTLRRVTLAVLEALHGRSILVALSDPGQVVVGQRTWRLVGCAFSLDERHADDRLVEDEVHLAGAGTGRFQAHLGASGYDMNLLAARRDGRRTPATASTPIRTAMASSLRTAAMREYGAAACGAPERSGRTHAVTVRRLLRGKASSFVVARRAAE